MILTANSDTAKKARRAITLSGGQAGWETPNIGPRRAAPGTETYPSPQAFVIEMSPQSIVRPHFHDHDQFQVFVSGNCTVGRHPVQALSVHYANRQTGYGPITAGNGGVAYFVLRQVADSGASFLPGAKDLQDRLAPKLQIISDPIGSCVGAVLEELSEATTLMLIEPKEDGLAAWILRVPPGESAASPVSASGTGRFFIVTSGTMVVAGDQLPALSPVFASHDEQTFDIQAGSTGLEVMVLQFPGGMRVHGRLPKSA